MKSLKQIINRYIRSAAIVMALVILVVNRLCGNSD